MDLYAQMYTHVKHFNNYKPFNHLSQNYLHDSILVDIFLIGVILRSYCISSLLIIKPHIFF